VPAKLDRLSVEHVVSPPRRELALAHDEEVFVLKNDVKLSRTSQKQFEVPQPATKWAEGNNILSGRAWMEHRSLRAGF
jgi:hypothetical protein